MPLPGSAGCGWAWPEWASVPSLPRSGPPVTVWPPYYKLAYDSEFETLSAGSLLTGMLLRHALDEDHVQEVDYLTGDDSYTRDWMRHRCERRRLAAFNPRWARGVVAGAGNLASHWGQALWRRIGHSDRDTD